MSQVELEQCMDLRVCMCASVCMRFRLAVWVTCVFICQAILCARISWKREKMREGRIVESGRSEGNGKIDT